MKLRSEQKHVRELHLEFKKEIADCKFIADKLIFEDVGDKDVYNITVPFLHYGKNIIVGRVESRDSEHSKVVFF